MIARVRSTRHHAFRAEASDRPPRGIEFGVGRKCLVSSSIAIRRIDPGKVDSHGCYIGGAELEVSKIMVNACRVAWDVATPEVPGEAVDIQQLQLVSGSERRQVLLIALQIDLRIGRDPGCLSVGKQRLSIDAVGNRQVHRNHGILEVQRCSWHSAGKKAGSQGKSSGKKIVLPEVWQDGGNRARGMEDGV